MPATAGVKGAGYYDQHSEAQLSAIQAIQGWVDDAVANLALRLHGCARASRNRTRPGRGLALPVSGQATLDTSGWR
jgi:hypothetical protein